MKKLLTIRARTKEKYINGNKILKFEGQKQNKKEF
jgi:hypothetical protein